MAVLRNNFLALRQYREYLKIQTTCSAATLKVYEAYDSLVLDWAEDKPLSKAPEFEITFPKYLISQRNANNESYSAEYMKGICGYTRRFFEWARDNKKDYRNITGEWIKMIKPEKNIEGVHEILFYKQFPKIATIHQRKHIIEKHISGKRNRSNYQGFWDFVF